MIITSLSYFAFVGISLLIYWFIPHRFQWIVLLIDSLFFYFMSADAYTFIYVLVSSGSAYAAGLLMTDDRYKKHKKLILISTIVLNVGILAVLKYTNMFIGTLSWALNTEIKMLSLVAPLAISYYTLQIVAYVIDCFLGSVKPEKNYLKLLLFSTFFPQMVSGPISRWKDLGTKLFEEHRFDYDRVVTGMRRILWGMAKKLVVADNLATPVGYMFNNPDSFKGIWTVIAAFAFVIELYFDFSGCMDIVIGVAECFGIKLAENFKAPFLSKTVQEFWQRWHITLGGWLKDYIMYPISRSKAFKKWGKRCKTKFGKKGMQIPYYAAMFVVWTLMGVWHGNSWKYVIGEGWYFWIIIVAGQLLADPFTKLKKTLRINDQSFGWHCFQVVRTAILFAIGNIAFRAASMWQMLQMYRNMFTPSSFLEPLRELEEESWDDFGGQVLWVGAAIIFVIQIVIDVRVYKGQKIDAGTIKRIPLPVRWAIYLVLTAFIILCRVKASAVFVYFQF